MPRFGQTMAREWYPDLAKLGGGGAAKYGQPLEGGVQIWPNSGVGGVPRFGQLLVW